MNEVESRESDDENNGDCDLSGNELSTNERFFEAVHLRPSLLRTRMYNVQRRKHGPPVFTTRSTLSLMSVAST